MTAGHDSFKKHLNIIIILSIVTLTLVIYWPVKDYGFLNYDDQLYVTENIKTQSGLSIKNIVNIFKDFHSEGIWHPVTMLSHAMDWQLFRFNAGGHHWTNVIIHIINAVLLFVLFRLMTGAIWRSALIAVLFAVHPINVESVAWIAERKNVLSTFFWFLTMLFYVRYVAKPDWKRYLPILISFALGLMSKPMLVTLPFVLLLLDYWPLNRIKITNQPGYKKSYPDAPVYPKTRLLRLWLEKVPIFILAAMTCLLTIYTQKAVNAVVDIQSFPLLYRLENSVISYVLYMKKMIWPFDLAVFYPFNYNMSLWCIFFCLFIIIVTTVFACFYFRRFPYLITGWFWFLGTLVPVIGIIQVGSQSMADRYAYVPLIGIFIGLIWGAGDIIKKRKLKIIPAAFALLMILILTITACFQVRYWKDTLALFSRAVSVTENNAFAHSNVAGELLVQNRTDEAMVHCEKALLLDPYDYNTLVRAARGYSVRGEHDKAVHSLQRAMELHPEYIRAYDDLYILLMQRGETKEALQVYAKAVEVIKDNPDIYYHYGTALARQGYYNDSILQYSKALSLRPDDADIIINIGIVLMISGKNDDAIQYFTKAVEINPRHANAHYQLSIVLKKKGLVEEANKHFREAERLNPAFKK